ARAATGAKDMVVLEHGYHGCTTGALDISPYKYAHPTLHGAPDWVHEVPQPDLYRGRFWRSHPGDTAPYLSALDQILESIAALGRGVAGFICECLPSVGGQIVLPPGYLRSAYARVRGAGGVCIADDVQTGLGRLGGSFWGFEPQEVVPDIVVLGKPLGNGYPLAAAVTTPAIAEAFAEGPEFFSTFGGSSASCAAGRAVLEVLKREDLPARAKSVGQQLSDGFRALAGAHPSIGEVRGMGLFWGLEMVSSRAERTPDAARAASLKRALYERHILIGTDGPDDNVLKIRPPMTFDHEAAAHLLSVLSDVLDTSAP
ncbi:MAG: aminotransferase class III-fold pyridoxal phosphate-dependent enzyme, partial [Myxococcota bacterium]